MSASACALCLVSFCKTLSRCFAADECDKRAHVDDAIACRLRNCVDDVTRTVRVTSSVRDGRIQKAVDGVGVEVSARRSAALRCRPVCADCSYRLQQPVVVSHFLRCLGLSWYPGPGPRPAASLSMAPEPGTDYRQPPYCQNCRHLHSSASSRLTPSSTGVLVVAVSRIYRRPELLPLL